jgi:type IX secretion system PorP/SprF family membrane protein
MCHRLILFLAFFLGGWKTAVSQQQPVMSAFQFNPLPLNPAFAGISDHFRFSATQRSQWMGIEGHPTTQWLCVDAPAFSRSIGLGGSIVHDAIGITRTTTASADAAYHLPTAVGRLSFALRGGLRTHRADFGSLVVPDPSDPRYADAMFRTVVAFWGFGVALKPSQGKWFVGAALPEWRWGEGKLGSEDARFHLPHAYLTAAATFATPLSRDVRTMCSLRQVRDGYASFDLNGQMEVFGSPTAKGQQIWVGMGYRTSRSLLMSVEWQITPLMRVLYAYDLVGSGLLSPVGSGHEISLGLDLTAARPRLQHPHYLP